MEKLLLIAPNENIKNTAHQLKEKVNAELIIREGVLLEGVLQAKKELDKGPMVIISRGGTAKELAKQLNAPVVDIGVSSLDVLKALYPLNDEKKIIGVMGYQNVIGNARAVASILGMNILFFPISEEKEIHTAMQSARECNVEIFIGDTITAMWAKHYGFACHLINSGEEAVLTAIETAISVSQARNKERKKKNWYKKILDSIDDGVVAVNDEENLVIINAAAQKFLGLPPEQLKNSPIMNRILAEDTDSESDMAETHITSCGYSLVAKKLSVDENDKSSDKIIMLKDTTLIEDMETKVRHAKLKKSWQAKRNFESIICYNSKMRQIVTQADRYAKTDSTVLICGESGTGKEIIAQSIHNASTRKNNPFVAVNCATISGNALESELFGYISGAFEGARKEGKRGVFELAHTGTIFLDELSELNLSVQAKILRVIQEQEVMRQGSEKIIPIDVRIIAATNVDLLECVREKKFRSDLYYRINVLKINMPKLCQRAEDIIPLANRFIAEFSERYSIKTEPLSTFDTDRILHYSWPGNIRQLQNHMERYVLSGVLELDEQTDKKSICYSVTSGKDNLKRIEREAILRVLEEEGYNKTRTAKRLGISRVTLDAKIKE